MALPGFTAECARGVRSGRYRWVGSERGPAGTSSDVTPAVHCHFETHTPDATHGSCWAYDHAFSDWCWYAYCD
jgi:hypothetical protein